MTAAYELGFPSDRLFARATRILDDAGSRYGRAFDWTLGGGTVLALRHGHRRSKDIDVFVPDPQYLGYLTPRLSDVAGEGDPDYEEAAEYVKLRYAEGEVDFVVGGLLTTPGAQPAIVQGRLIQLETDLEILAKKLFFRGDRFKARDLFDLAMLLESNVSVAAELSPWATRHRIALTRLLESRADSLRATFEAIDALQVGPDFSTAVEQGLAFLRGTSGHRSSGGVTE